MKNKIIKLVNLFTVMIFLNSSVVVQPISKENLKKIGIGVGVAVGAAALAGGVGYGLHQRSKSKELAMQGKVPEQPVVQNKTPRSPSYPNPNAKPVAKADKYEAASIPVYVPGGVIPPPPPLPASESKVVVPSSGSRSIPVYVPGGVIPPPPPLPASESKVVVSPFAPLAPALPSKVVVPPSAPVAPVIPPALPVPNLPKSKADKYGASAVKKSLVGPPGGAPLASPVIPQAPPAPKVLSNLAQKPAIEVPKEEPKIEKKEASVSPALPFSPENLQDLKGKLKKPSERKPAQLAGAEKSAPSDQDFLRQALQARGIRSAVAGKSDKPAVAIGQGLINKNVIDVSPQVIENKPIVENKPIKNVQDVPAAKVVPVAPVAPALQKDAEAPLPRANVVRPSANVLQGVVLKKAGEAKEVNKPVVQKPAAVNVGLQQAIQKQQKLVEKKGAGVDDEWED